MDDAGALPDPHVFAAGLLFHVIAQIHIRQEQDRLLARNRVDDVHGVARGAELTPNPDPIRGDSHSR